MNEKAIFHDNFLTGTNKAWSESFLHRYHYSECRSRRSALHQRQCLEEQTGQHGERDILLERDRLANSDHKNDSGIVQYFPKPLDLWLSV